MEKIFIPGNTAYRVCIAVVPSTVQRLAPRS